MLIVTDLRVLPACHFKAIYAQPREVKHYTGYRQVHQTRVHPADETSFKNRRKKLKGNPVIESKVSVHGLLCISPSIIIMVDFISV